MNAPGRPHWLPAIGLAFLGAALCIRVPAGTNPPPSFRGWAVLSGTQLQADVEGKAGKQYRLEWNSGLADGSWWTNREFLTAEQTNFSILEDGSAAGPRFYRLAMFPGTNPPSWPPGSQLQFSVPDSNAVKLTWGTATGLLDVVGYAVYQDGILITTLEAGVRSYEATGLGIGTAYAFRVEAMNEDTNWTVAGPSVEVNPSPVAPTIAAPPTAYSSVSLLQSDNSFLYARKNPVQTGVNTQSMDSTRYAMVRGSTVGRLFEPLPFVVISVEDHPEYGHTVSRADGQYDLAVNGGGLMTLLFERDDRLPVRRNIDPAWQDNISLPPVKLITLDTNITALTLPLDTIQVATGSLMQDQDGERTLRLLVPTGTVARMLMPDGTTQVLTTAHMRLSEYTSGTNGIYAMPALLPESSEYTYAADISVDEARTSGALRVEFTPDVVGYIENLAGFPIGCPIPVGSLDAGVWAPQKDGRVIEMLGETGGLADLDVDGDGLADTGAALEALGITDSERQKVAELYSAGTELWRAPFPHLSGKDMNWAPGTDGKKGDSKVKKAPKAGKPARKPGHGVLEMQNQILHEDIDVVGAPFTLHYASDRAPGYLSDHMLDIELIGTSVPSGLIQVDLTIQVAGRSFEQTLSPQANLTNTFLWDGLDTYGRTIQGVVPALCRIDYVFPGYYCYPAPGVNGFATMTGHFVTNAGTGERVRMRNDMKLSTSHESDLGGWNAMGHALGGWSLSIHHVYDAAKGVVYLGDGGRQDVNGPSGNIILSSAGTGTNGFSGDGGDATEAQMNTPRGAVIGPDGSTYVADTDNHRIRKISAASNVIETIAGTGAAGFGGDGGAGTNAQVSSPRSLAVGSDGSLYFCDTGNNRVRRLDTNGVVTTVVGTGIAGFGGDAGAATNAQVNGPQGLAVAPDGTLFIADTENNRVRRVGTDGTIATVTGSGTAGYSGDDGPCVDAQVSRPSGIALDRDGTLYIADTGNNRVRALRRDGRISTFAGTGASGYGGDGGDPSAATLNAPASVAVGRDSTVYVADASNNCVRKVGSRGVISTAGGTGTAGYSGEGSPGPQAEFSRPEGITVGPDRRAYVADSQNGAVRGMGRSTIAGGLGETKIGSEDGSQVYVFDPAGRHLRTQDSFSGAVLYEFVYDSTGRLIRVRDVNSKTTEIMRDGSGDPTAIVAPYGQSTALGLNADGMLDSVTDPAGDATFMTYVSTGLMASITGPRGYAYSFSYDSRGLLTLATDPSGGTSSVPRVTGTNSHAVTETTAEGRSSGFSFEYPDEGGEHVQDQLPDGTVAKRSWCPNGAITNRLPDGTEVRAVQTAEPRFRMQTPFYRETKVVTPGGLISATTIGRTVDLLDRRDPLSMTEWRERTDNNGRVSVMRYDPAARVYTWTSPEGRTSSLKTDAAGRPLEQHTGDLIPTTYGYNTNGQLTVVTNGARLTRLGYNTLGYVSVITNALNQATRFQYDLAGRLTNRILANGETVGTSYDGEGNLVVVTPAGRPAHTFAYTPVNLRSEYTPPVIGGVSNTVRWTWNADRELVGKTRADGSVLTYVRNAAAQLASVRCPGLTNDYTYDPTNGHVASITRQGQVVTYQRDGRLLLSASWSGTVSGTVSRTWDSNFWVGSFSVGGTTVTNSYDDDGLLIRAGALEYARDTNGIVTAAAVLAASNTWQHNTFGELTNLAAWANGTNLLNIGYSRDPLGRIATLVERTAAGTTTNIYSYDSVGRLTHVTRGGPPAYDYFYDANGNRTNHAGPGFPAKAATYDAQDRILTYSSNTYAWSSDGELTNKVAGALSTAYRYDAFGNMVGVTLPGGANVEYVLDGQDRRVGKKVGGALVRGYLYLGQLSPMAELDGASNVVSVFVYGASATPDYMIRSGTVYRIVTDHLGSPRFVVDAQSGVIAQQLTYDEFGRVLTDSNPGFQPFGFAGGLYDPDTGLTHFGAREYDAEMGRWMARDPTFFLLGGPNLYVYCRDPVNSKDVLGCGPASVTPSAASSAAGLSSAEQAQILQTMNQIGNSYGALTSIHGTLWGANMSAIGNMDGGGGGGGGGGYFPSLGSDSALNAVISDALANPGASDLGGLGAQSQAGSSVEHDAAVQTMQQFNSLFNTLNSISHSVQNSQSSIVNNIRP